MNFSGIVVSVILGCMVVIVFGVYLVGMSAQYGVTYNDTLSGMNQESAIVNLSNTLAMDARNSTKSTGGFAAIGDLLGAGWKTFRLSYLSFDMMGTMIHVAFNNLSASVGGSIVMVFEALLLALLMTLAGFAIISFVSGRKP